MKYLTTPPKVTAVYANGGKDKGNTTGVNYDRTGFYTPGYTSAYSTDGGTRHDSFNMTDCIVDGTNLLNDGPANESNKWASRCRGIMSGKSLRVWAQSWKEHSWYWDILGSYTFEECTADSGAQGFQIEDRPQAWFPGYSLSMMSDIRWTRCYAHECGKLRGQGRASAAWAIYRERGLHLLLNCRAKNTQGDIGTGHKRIVQLKGTDPSLIMHGGRYSYAQPSKDTINLLAGEYAGITRASFSPGINIFIGANMREVLVAGCRGDGYIQTPDKQKRPISKGIEYRW